MDTTTHLTLDASGRLGQGGIAFATAFVARASAGNLWLRMASMLRCFIDASSMLHRFMQLLVSSGFQVSNSVSGRAPCCQEGEAQLCVFKRGKRQCCTVMNGPSAHSASNSSIAAKLRM